MKSYIQYNWNQIIHATKWTEMRYRPTVQVKSGCKQSYITCNGIRHPVTSANHQMHARCSRCFRDRTLIGSLTKWNSWSCCTAAPSPRGSAGTVREHRAVVVDHQPSRWDSCMGGGGGAGGRGGQLQHVGLIWAHNARSRGETSLYRESGPSSTGSAVRFGRINSGGRERNGKTRRFSVRRTETAAAATDRAAGGNCACARACARSRV